MREVLRDLWDNTQYTNVCITRISEERKKENGFQKTYFTWTLAGSVHSVVAKMRQIHTDYQVLWRKRDGMATLSRGECPDHCHDRLLLA